MQLKGSSRCKKEQQIKIGVDRVNEYIHTPNKVVVMNKKFVIVVLVAIVLSVVAFFSLKTKETPKIDPTFT